MNKKGSERDNILSLGTYMVVGVPSSLLPERYKFRDEFEGN